jgi:uncharacterized phiE125 gp8 family phage protein
MSLRVLEPPAVMPISVSEAKAHLRYTSSQQDAVIAGMVAEAVAHIDGPEGALGRCLIAQTLELTADEWPYRFGCIRLPCPPLISVTSVHYVDQDGAEQLVDPATYQVVGIGDQGRLELAHGQTWPSARRQSEAIRITYRAGHGDSWNDVPEALRLAVLTVVATYFDRRSAFVEGGVFETSAAERLLAPFKVHQP